MVNSSSQQGHTFGERLQKAFATFFARGFAKVIIIGNDCAQLRTKDIKQAATLLQQKAAVFGPARDGGVYLLGLDKTLFEQNTGFAQINWQTSSVLAELQAWSNNYETINLATVYSDLDTYQDLQVAYYNKQLPQLLLTLLAAVFSTLQYQSSPFTFSFKNYLTPSFSFRGPPLFS
ncbi:TIGR04282 family arsenosugar biosynthesis glycosyltransferase [Adhaeribacter arboris]|uniref:TIGR04282 family arsenosugar biosynthesis glycosyltransferase n=1 Tax=Adhaeribacter arboris TaxID=2072846 RepID=UPI001304BC58|nr:DUF2064 domain-containing protein [Adhaeribacter arboris]